MDFDNEVMRALGRIEGKLEEMQKETASMCVESNGLSERVSKLERWQSWLKGAWAACATAIAFLLKGLYGK